MIYVTGDCHGNWPKKFSLENFSQQKEMTKDDYVIVCGDFGIWDKSVREDCWLNWLSEKPFTTLFVDGNHENFDILDSMPVEIWSGGKIHKIRHNIFHLMRGQLFEIEGKRFFTFGGASSHDINDGILYPEDFTDKDEFRKVYCKMVNDKKMFRINRISWWEQELPSEEELREGVENLKKADFKVDYIISHCCNQSIANFFSNGDYKKDILTRYFDEIAEKVSFSKWFFGHYHGDASFFTKYFMVYDSFIRIL